MLSAVWRWHQTKILGITFCSLYRFVYNTHITHLHATYTHTHLHAYTHIHIHTFTHTYTMFTFMQAIRYETSDVTSNTSPLVRLLIERSCNRFEIANYLYWYVSERKAYRQRERERVCVCMCVCALCVVCFCCVRCLGCFL
jgi:hypothetical protein